MLTALILVCSLATISNDCTRDNALDVVYVPATFDCLAACMMRAQAYVAYSSIGRDLPQTEAFRVICVGRSINAADTPARWAGYSSRTVPRDLQRSATTVQAWFVSDMVYLISGRSVCALDMAAAAAVTPLFRTQTAC